MHQPTETHHRLQGLTCGHCEMSVREAVRRLPGVEAVVADSTDGSLFVRGTLELHRIRQAVETAGYTLLD